MKRTFSIFAGLMLGTATLFAGDKEDISKVFSDYKVGMQEADGEKFLKSQSDAFSDMLEDFREKALKAEKEELLKEGPMLVMSVLQMRGMLTKEQLEDFSVEEIANAMAKGNEAGAEVLEKQEIGEIEVNEDSAKAQIVYDGNAMQGMDMPFIKEDGKWVIDAKTLYETAAEAMKDVEFTDEMYVSTMKIVLKDKATEELWALPK